LLVQQRPSIKSDGTLLTLRQIDLSTYFIVFHELHMLLIRFAPLPHMRHI
jgi:hypothetical protein